MKNNLIKTSNNESFLSILFYFGISLILLSLISFYIDLKLPYAYFSSEYKIVQFLLIIMGFFILFFISYKNIKLINAILGFFIIFTMTLFGYFIENLNYDYFLNKSYYSLHNRIIKINEYEEYFISSKHYIIFLNKSKESKEVALLYYKENYGEFIPVSKDEKLEIEALYKSSKKLVIKKIIDDMLDDKYISFSEKESLYYNVAKSELDEHGKKYKFDRN